MAQFKPLKVNARPKDDMSDEENDGNNRKEAQHVQIEQQQSTNSDIKEEKEAKKTNDPWPIQLNRIGEMYDIGPKIGSGNIWVSRKCKRHSDDKIFAIKIYNKCITSRGFSRGLLIDAEELKRIENEANILRSLSHSNIVNLHGYYDHEKKAGLILDYCDGGELFDRIIEKGSFSENEAKKIFYQACCALEYIHSKGIVHRNLIPESILFETKGDDLAIKISGFDYVGVCKDGPCGTPCGTPNYVAPEILKKMKYKTEVDMWACGMVLYIMLCGFSPFYDETGNLANLYGKITRAEFDMPDPYWTTISNDAKDLVRKLLEKDPEKRLTAKMALSHQWMFNKGKVMALIAGYIRSETKCDVLLTVSSEIICDFSVLLFSACSMFS
eukprot:97582_1